jgi:UDP:flavonoid glycosyltransferase YjiC (YdhE family)
MKLKKPSRAGTKAAPAFNAQAFLDSSGNCQDRSWNMGARVVFHGAGVRVKPTASATKIRHAVRDVLESSGYRDGARRLGEEIAKDARDSRAVPVLEAVANRATRP